MEEKIRKKRVVRKKTITIDRMTELSNKRFLTFQDAADLLGVSRGTVMFWVKNGHLNTVNLPTSNFKKGYGTHKLKRLTKSELQRFVKKSTVNERELRERKVIEDAGNE